MVLKLAENPVPSQMRARETPNAPTYWLLAHAYMDKNNEILDIIEYKHDGFVAAGVNMDKPSRFDNLDGYMFECTMKFLNKQYQECQSNSKKSGEHDEFSSYCNGKPWILLYHLLLNDSQVQGLRSIVVPALPDEVMHNSLKRSTDTEAQKKQENRQTKSRKAT